MEWVKEIKNQRCTFELPILFLLSGNPHKNYIKQHYSNCIEIEDDLKGD